MAGFVPAIFLSLDGPSGNEPVQLHGAITGTRSVARAQRPGPKIFFIIFVDAMFTTLFERLFTNSFDGGRKKAANPCLCPLRTTD
jgi:hypothetical protein